MTCSCSETISSQAAPRRRPARRNRTGTFARVGEASPPRELVASLWTTPRSIHPVSRPAELWSSSSCAGNASWTPRYLLAPELLDLLARLDQTFSERVGFVPPGPGMNRSAPCRPRLFASPVLRAARPRRRGYESWPTWKRASPPSRIAPALDDHLSPAVQPSRSNPWTSRPVGHSFALHFHSMREVEASAQRPSHRQPEDWLRPAAGHAAGRGTRATGSGALISTSFPGAATLSS